MPSKRRCKSNERRNSKGYCVDKKRSISAKKAWRSRSRSLSKSPSYKSYTAKCAASEIRNPKGYCVDRIRSFKAKKAWRKRKEEETKDLYGLCRSTFPGNYPSSYSQWLASSSSAPPSYSQMMTSSVPFTPPPTPTSSLSTSPFGKIGPQGLQ